MDPYSDCLKHIEQTDLLLEAAVEKCPNADPSAARFRLNPNPYRFDEDLALKYRSVRDSVTHEQPVIPANGEQRMTRFQTLVTECGAESLESDLLRLALGGEIRSDYARIFALLNDDMRKDYLSLEIARRLLSQVYSDIPSTLFGNEMPLIARGVIRIEPENGSDSYGASRIRINPRYLRYITGTETIDRDFQASLQKIYPPEMPEEPPIDRTVLDRVAQIMLSRDTGMVLGLCGRNGSGRMTTARALASVGRLQLRVFDHHTLARDLRDHGALQDLFALSRLDGACVALRVNTPIESDRLGELVDSADKTGAVVFIAGGQDLRIPSDITGCPVVHITIDSPDTPGRKVLWLKHLPPSIRTKENATKLAGSFDFTPGMIQTAVHRAELSLAGADPRKTKSPMETLRTICTELSGTAIHRMAKRICPVYSWNDLVLPPEPLSRLQEIVTRMHLRDTVYDTWNVGSKVDRSRGVCALFTGESGTGKTLAAEVIAGELQSDLYKVDLSQIVSKYIGETEKNLDLVFEETRKCRGVLFFDEADALFGKRTSVKDAHDRYANIEVGYLLQRIEEYDGVVILATNLKGNIDRAFQRRFQFIVPFPFPEPPQRTAIWEHMFSSGIPCSPKLDFEYLGEHLSLSGGNIRNIAVTSAFLAAGNGRMVTMTHMVEAVVREYRKIGRFAKEADLGPYAHLLPTENERVSRKGMRA